MATWRLVFHVELFKNDGPDVLKSITELDPPPKSATVRDKGSGSSYVDIDFLVEADDQFDAVRQQNEINKKLWDLLENLDEDDFFSITFDGPVADSKKPRAS